MHKMVQDTKDKTAHFFYLKENRGFALLIFRLKLHLCYITFLVLMHHLNKYEVTELWLQKIGNVKVTQLCYKNKEIYSLFFRKFLFEPFWEYFLEEFKLCLSSVCLVFILVG